MQTLDPYSLPLNGISLLEASAGTGKTYTLTLLYLRLLLEKNLSVDQILVLTFTRAATEELRSRIRLRIRDTMHALSHPLPEEPTLSLLLAGLSTSQAKQRLSHALVRMDEAAIYTIHGFCQRLLQDNAFETRTPFQAEFIEQERPLRLQIMEDFWRLHLYPADQEMVRWFTNHWSSPEELLDTVAKTLAAHAVRIIPEDISAQRKASEPALQALHAEVSANWKSHRPEICSIIQESTDLTRNEKTYRLHDKVPELIAAMDVLADCSRTPLCLPNILQLLKQSIINRNVKKRCSNPPRHSFFVLFEDFADLHRHYEQLSYADTLLQARDYLISELHTRKTMQGCLFFDDLLVRVHSGLEDKKSGASFAQRIAAQYPAVLVDEFQDTDPLQYRIFSKIHQSHKPHWLCLIGDPKQAIYSFRGADIYTYVQARRATQEHCRFTMGTNYRSCGPMVRAINRLFTVPNPFLSPDIHFTAVDSAANNQEQVLRCMGEPVSPLHLFLLDPEPKQLGIQKPFNKETGDQLAADCTARQIALLVTQGQTGDALIDKRPVTPGDIAVLVRTHREAVLIQEALADLGMTSVAFSQNSVFLTDEARQLAATLTAIMDPADRQAVRTALAGHLFGMTATDIDRLNQDAISWNEAVSRLVYYQDLWGRQGIMVMFQVLISTEGLTRRMTCRKDGARIMTNFLHLAELLQAAPASAHGRGSLLRWFAEQRHQPDPLLENQQIRLEDDQRLVQIVTIHKSKGLEYPIVFLPFLWRERPFNPVQPILFHDRQTCAPTVDLMATNSEIARLAEEEDTAEQMRLLYVALTRARYVCYFCAGWARGYENAPLFTLLPTIPVEAMQDLALLEQVLGSHFNEEEHLLTVSPGWSTSAPLSPKQDQEDKDLAPLPFTGTIQPGLTMTSYSRLCAQADDHELQQNPAPPSAEPNPTDQPRSPFSFPRGAFAGTCLHNILEEIDYSQPPEAWSDNISAELRRAGIAENWQELVTTWLIQILGTPLPGSCPLQEVTLARRITELEFLFPLENMSMQRFNKVLSRFHIPELAHPDSLINGLLKGFIDLVFEHEGRYFIADHKSNYLGQDYASYDQASLAKAMRQHRYDLQYLLYTVALHRYLKIRLTDYTYHSHFGGVYYLFLRGMGAVRPPETGIFFTRPDASLIQALDTCFNKTNP